MKNDVEMRNNLKDFVGKDIIVEGFVTKCYDDTQRILIREIFDEKGNFLASHCNMFTDGDKRYQKGKEKAERLYNEVKNVEKRKIKFIARVTCYKCKKNGEINYGLSFFKKLLEVK